MGAVQEDENLFENHIFEQIHLAVNSPELPHFLKVRPLRISDYQRGYCDLLSQLTVIGNLTENCFRERFHLMRNANPSSYYIIVIEDSSVGKVVASGTLTVEFKFIHNGSCRGRIEDIVVDEKMRGKKLGRMLLIYLRFINEMPQLPSNVTLGCELCIVDEEWTFDQLPKESVEIPREHLPEPGSDSLPSIINVRQESVAELERRWLDVGLDRISLDHPDC